MRLYVPYCVEMTANHTIIEDIAVATSTTELTAEKKLQNLNSFSLKLSKPET